MNEKKQRATDVKVGLFVVLGIVATFLSLFLVGQERSLFEETASLRAQFSNVGGLKVGAAVRLAGVNIGIVSQILLPETDEGADTRVVKPVSVGDIELAALDGNVPIADVLRDRDAAAPAERSPPSQEETPSPDGEETKKPAIELPLHETTFASPTNLALFATDPDAQLEVVVEVNGKNLHDQSATERIMLRLRKAQDMAVGKVHFKSVDSVRIVVLKGNEVNEEKGKKIEPPVISVGDGSARKLTVIMRLSEKYLERIRTDSEASVVGEGLLGDKYIDISIGSTSRPQVQDGDMLLSNDAMDFTAALADAGQIIDDVSASTESIRALLDGFRKAGGEATVIAAMESIQDLSTEIQNGNGLQMLLDKKAAGEVKDIVANAKTSSESLDQSLAKLDRLLGDIKTNDSLVHELLYGKGGEKVVGDARGLISEATQIVSAVRTEKGFVHNLIYEEDRGEILANASAASADVKAMAADLRAIIADTKTGKGTVGRLLTDPSVYEDLKVLIGNVRRNDAVKALVRYSISQADKKATTPPKPKEPSE